MKEDNFYPTRESFPTNCDNCGVSIETEPFKGKGASTDKKPLGHKDPRHDFGAYCSINCSKEHNDKGGTIYRKD